MEGMENLAGQIAERIRLRMKANESASLPNQPEPVGVPISSTATSDSQRSRDAEPLRHSGVPGMDTGKCPYGRCDGSGIIPMPGNSAVNCECLRLREMKGKLAFAEIPAEFQSLKVKDFDTARYTGADRKTAETVKRLVIGYINRFEEMREMGKGLYLYGEAKGSGKTQMAVSIGNALISRYRQNVRFVTTVNLLNEIKNSFEKPSDDSESFSKLLAAVKSVDVLILDDIGTEKPTSWVSEIFYSILNDRMTARMITVFTSNCRVEDLQHDSKVVNRIGKMAMPVKFPDESVRTALAKQENEEVIKMLLGG